jgi:hypothetical protein
MPVRQGVDSVTPSQPPDPARNKGRSVKDDLEHLLPPANVSPDQQEEEAMLDLAGTIGAVFFLLLAAEGRLAGPFPYFAAGGDIITALVALPMMRLASAPSGAHTSAIMAWNLFGIADLVLAITLGVTSAEGSPLQVFHTPPGSEAMQQLPWSFVPTVLVPLWLILHAIIWAQLRQRARAS